MSTNTTDTAVTLWMFDSGAFSTLSVYISFIFFSLFTSLWYLRGLRPATRSSSMLIIENLHKLWYLRGLRPSKSSSPPKKENFSLFTGKKRAFSTIQCLRGLRPPKFLQKQKNAEKFLFIGRRHAFSRIWPSEGISTSNALLRTPRRREILLHRGEERKFFYAKVYVSN